MERIKENPRIVETDAFAHTIGAWLLWVSVCGMAYWGYWGWATAGSRGHVSISLSLIYWGLAVVLMPVMIYRNRDPLGALLPPSLLLSVYYLMIQEAIGV